MKDIAYTTNNENFNSSLNIWTPLMQWFIISKKQVTLIWTAYDQMADVGTCWYQLGTWYRGIFVYVLKCTSKLYAVLIKATTVLCCFHLYSVVFFSTLYLSVQLRNDSAHCAKSWPRCEQKVGHLYHCMITMIKTNDWGCSCFSAYCFCLNNYWNQRGGEIIA